MAFRTIIQISCRSSMVQKFVKRQISSTWIPVSSSLTRGPAERITTHQYTCPVYSVMYTQTRTFMDRIKGMLGMEKMRYKKKHLRAVGTTMYFQYSRSIDSIQIMKDLELPDTFMSWFKVAELHVWMIMYRLAREGLEGRHARNGLVSALWRDVDLRTQSMKEDGGIRKKEDYDYLQDHFMGALLSYDEGILSHDRVLAGAVWRGFFELKEVDAEKIERMVEYIRKQVKHLEELDSNKMIASGTITLLQYNQL